MVLAQKQRIVVTYRLLCATAMPSTVSPGEGAWFLGINTRAERLSRW